MNNLLFTVLIIALLYYFFYYLPQQKKLVSNSILTPTQTTQANPILKQSTNETTVDLPSAQFIPDPEAIKKLEKDIAQKETTIIDLNNSYSKLETNKNKEITNLKTQITTLQSEIRDLAKRPLKPTNSKGTQTDELTKTLDNLIKEVQDLNNSL